MFVSIKWKSMIFLSLITLCILLFVLFYNIEKTQNYFEQKRVEKVQFDNKVFQQILLDKTQLLSQTSELAEHLLYDDLHRNSDVLSTQHIEHVWETLNEQMDLLVFEVWKTSENVTFQRNDLSETFDDNEFQKRLAIYIKQAQFQGERQFFIHCFNDCVFFNIEAVPFRGEVYFLVVGKNLADTFILFNKAVNNNVGILKHLDQKFEYSLISSNERLLKKWNRQVIAITEFETTLPLLKSISEQHPNLTEVENKMFNIEDEYFSIVRLDAGLNLLENLTNQSQKVDFIILHNESEDYLQLRNRVNDILLFGFLIWILSELFLLYVMNQLVYRLKNLSKSLKLLTQQKFEEAKKNVFLSKSSRLVDEFDELEQSDLQLIDTLKSLNTSNRALQVSIGNQLTQIKRSVAFSKRVINESNSFILIQDSRLNVLLINSKLEKILGSFFLPKTKKESALNAMAKNELPLFQNFCSDKSLPENFLEKMHNLVGKHISCFEHDAKFLKTDSEEMIYIAWSHVRVEDENGNPIILSEGTDLTERVKAENKLVWLAYHDTLTGLKNRRAFIKEIKKVIEHKHKALILLVDINRFRAINDLYGSFVGDTVLNVTSERIKREIRINDSVFRLAADEFGVVLYRIQEQEIPKIVSKFAKMLQLEFDIESIENGNLSEKRESHINGLINYDCSVGALYSENINCTEEMISKLAYALLHAKQVEGKSWYIHDKDDDDIESVKRENYVAQKIHQAMKQDSVHLVFQPIWCIFEQKISHYEVLTRIIFDDGERIFPDEFIQVAEKHSIIHKLDDHILDKAFCILAEKIKTDPAIRFSINVSAPTLQQSNYDEIVLKQLKTHAVPAKNITLEVTETSVISNFKLAHYNLEKLVKNGLTIALDDFGVGFTSINYLKAMPLSYVKLDGLYIKDIVDKKEDQVFVESITAIASAYGLKVIAEYVENQAILEKLETLGVSHAQGYFIGKPEPHFLPTNFKPVATQPIKLDIET